MKEKLATFIFKRFYKADDRWMYDDKFINKYRFYVTENPDNIRTLGSGFTYVVKEASKYSDGFLSYVGCIKVDDFYIAVMNADRPEEVRWHLKMVNNGWEMIPRKHYNKLVDVA